MAVEQLPARVREFANYLDGLLGRLDQGGGWCAVFWQRDPEGMRACLNGRELPPWDVLESLLQDLAAAHGPAVATAERERARALHTAAVSAYDTLPGARDALGDRLDVMLREQRYAAERRSELTRRLSAATSREETEALRLDLAWAHDDHDRATARRAELEARLSRLDAGARGAGPYPAGPPRPQGGPPLGERHSGTPPNPWFAAPAAEPESGPGVSPEGHDSVPSAAEPEFRSGVSLVGRDGRSPSTAEEEPRPGASRAGRDPEVPSVTERRPRSGTPEADAFRAPEPGHLDAGRAPAGGLAWPGVLGADAFRAPEPGHLDAGRAPAGGPAEPGAPEGDAFMAPRSGRPDAGGLAELGTPEGYDFRASGPGDPDAGRAPAGGPAEPRTLTPAPDPAPPPAGARRRRRGGARFAGAVEDGAVPVAVPPQAPLAAVPGASGGRRSPRGARFAGAVAGEEPVERPAEAVDALAVAAVAGAVERLVRLRAEGRTGEAHALLVEIAHWPAGRLPLLADGLRRAGLGADWDTLLWEAAALPAERLVAAAGALRAAGRAVDGRQMLRQGVARPAAEIGAAVLELAGQGRDREVRALLDAYVRVRTPEEAARSAAADPDRLVPLLLEAAAGTSEERHWDLVHALRVAGFAP
ncbi:hypothetical protein [Streptomyces sp. NPDC090057]|uniref:hypothetical protein n=1 Tax=Streptomyces sp. NPDC090057 TaxID=3365935 RepID=UPI00380FBD17